MSERPATAHSTEPAVSASGPTRILYCHCNYAQIISSETKKTVLEKLCASDRAFDAVADLCEMAARKDPALTRLSEGGPVKIAACFPRAVKWLFSGAKAPLNQDTTEVLNMRDASAEDIITRLLAENLQPNLPADNHPPQASEQPEEDTP
jgi:hypothetical protein